MGLGSNLQNPSTSVDGELVFIVLLQRCVPASLVSYPVSLPE
jgi:hypothetical protein